MKRILLTLACVSAFSGAFSQVEFDALKVSQTDIIGTARYTGVAGAFGALGGDASAIKDNPAGLGIFRKSELTATADILMQNVSSTWNGKQGVNDLFKYGFNNLTYVIALPTWRSESGYEGLLSSNFAFSYNKLKNFNRSVSINSKPAASSMTHYMAEFTDRNLGYYNNDWSNYTLVQDNYPMNGAANPYQNVDIPWISYMAYQGYLINDSLVNQEVRWFSLLNNGDMVTPSYTLREQGGIDEYNFGWSGNFSNRFFIGATVNMQSLYYRADSKYTESFQQNRSMGIDNTLIMNGTGFNVNVGAIFVPVDFIRFGLAMHTPMFYNLSMTNYADLNSSMANKQMSPENVVKYKQMSPFQLNASAAFLLDKKGFVSAEYVLNNYKGMRLQDQDGNSQAYPDENAGFGQMMNNSRTIKVGIEYKLTDNFALRGGFANSSAATRPDATKWFIPSTTRTDNEYFVHNRTDYFTAGLGYREAGWYIDMAYMNKALNETFYAYNSAILADAYKVNPATVKTTNNNVVITLGLRF